MVASFLFGIPWLGAGAPASLLGSLLYLLAIVLVGQRRDDKVVAYIDLQNWKTIVIFVLGSCLWGYAAEHILKKDVITCFCTASLWYYFVISFNILPSKIRRYARGLRKPENITKLMKLWNEIFPPEHEDEDPCTSDGDDVVGNDDA